jgi:aminoglycoside 3-N-acetyltransferase
MAARTAPPVDRARLRSDLTAAGLPTGALCLVHCSLRQVGRVDGGPATIVAVFGGVLGPRSTLVVPTFTARNSTTTREFRRRTSGMSARQRAAAEAAIIPFDVDATPAQDVGILAEHVRTLPGAVRSAHPQTSFAAVGPAAADVTRDHALDSHLGERSPLARLYERDAVVVLLGVGFASCTCFHLAEHRLPWPAPRRPYRAYVLADGVRTRCEFTAVDADDRDFAAIGSALESAGSIVRTAPVGHATALWFPLRDAVDFAVEWMTRWRSGGRPEHESRAV